MDRKRSIECEKRFLVDLNKVDPHAIIMQGEDNQWYEYHAEGMGVLISEEKEGEK